jgi:acyl-CoA synthetase (AMP-forming)/AMP-acid ligase II
VPIVRDHAEVVISDHLAAVELPGDDLAAAATPHDVVAAVAVEVARITVRLVDAESGRTLSEGEPGELRVKGCNVTPGYLNNPDASKQAVTSDGWFRTGELAYAHGRGFVYQARMKDGLRLKGYLVDPGEIGSHLMRHSGVAGAQVVGVKLPGEGDVAVAFVRPGESQSSEPELIAHCRHGIANYKVPRRIPVCGRVSAGAWAERQQDH